MSAPRHAHRLATRALSLVMVAIGLTLVVITLVNGGGALARGVVIGALFVAAGVGRLLVSLRGSL